VLEHHSHPLSWDSRRDLIVPGNNGETLVYCVEHFIAVAQEAIQDHGAFFVALSGGSTPKAIFQLLTSSAYQSRIAWNKVHLFWSDERAAPPDDPESNYHMAMMAGLSGMPIPPHQVHRMQAETNIEEKALAYENKILEVLKGRPFDLIMLGMGEDGHTASLFPHTEGLSVENRLVIANYIPQKKTWRMTMTYPCINSAKNVAIYVLGASKKQTLADVLTSSYKPDVYPIQRIGTPIRPALWIADIDAAAGLPSRGK
jgi:6-phosphogluconolactonase